MLITDIAQKCGVNEAIRTSTNRDSAWREIDYETMGGIKGTMIFAPVCGKAEDLRLPLPALGHCRIYVGIAAYGNDTGVLLRLEKENAWRNIRAYGINWFPEIMEYFYRETDLDGCALEIRRYPELSSLTWVRIEPATPVQVQPPDIEALVTCDGYWIDNFQQFMDKIAPLKDIRTGKFFFCLAHGDNCPHYPTKVGTFGMGDTVDYGRKVDVEIAAALKQLLEERPNFVKDLMDYVHSLGMEFHASIRTGAFYIPGFPSRSRFYQGHPEYHCRLRNGTEVERLSLAEPEVRRHWLELVNELMDFGCDGVHLILSRALPFVLFEPAFCSLFEKKFGMSPLELPESDERILQMREEIVTAFMRELRELLDRKGTAAGRHLQLTLTVPANGKLNESYGLNLPKLAKESIVDNITVDGALLVRTHNETEDNIEFEYFRDAVHGTACRWYPRGPGNAAKLPDYIRKAIDNGAAGLLFWDACENYVPNAAYWETLATLMRNPADMTQFPIRRFFPMRTFDGLDWDQHTPHNGF